MQRKNPGSSSQPNAPIDLTPLLDVIFIFLFVVIIAYAAKAQAVEAEAVSKTEELEKQVEELNARLTEEESLREMYEKRLSDYESDVIGGRVKIVTIYCTWDEEDSTKRQIRVLTSDKEFSPVNLTAENQENGYARLNQMLVDYITSNSDSVVVLSLNTESPGDSCFLVKQTDLFAANVAHHSRIANTVGVSKSVCFS